jgi:hypothetical protein
LCKANIAKVKELLHKHSSYGSQIRIISVVWSGNEFCGEHGGSTPLPLWGQDDPKGDWHELMKRGEMLVEQAANNQSVVHYFMETNV